MLYSIFVRVEVKYLRQRPLVSHFDPLRIDSV